jgi:MOSC domain-containing protein YiiM
MRVVSLNAGLPRDVEWRGRTRPRRLSGRTGFYLAVEREGDVGPEDTITLIDRDPHGVRVAEITRLYVTKKFSRADVAVVSNALRVVVASP